MRQQTLCGVNRPLENASQSSVFQIIHLSVKYFHSVQPINETREAIKEKIMTEKQMINKENITEEESEVL
jgi:hypothetical protein